MIDKNNVVSSIYKRNIRPALTINRWIIVLLVIFLIGIAAITWRVVDYGQQRTLEYQAIEIAEIIAIHTASARTVFTEHVSDKLAKDGFGADLHSDEKPGFVPIPAQLLKIFGKQAAEDSHGLFEFKLLSKWNLEPTQGLTDDFKRWAWAKLEAQDQVNPQKPIDWKPAWRFEEINGVNTLRYLRADPAASGSCVKCHNEFEALPEIVGRRKETGIEPGRKWVLNQLLGAIEVNIPLQNIAIIAAKQTNITTAIIVFLVAGGMLAITFFIIRDMLRTRTVAQELAWQANHDSLTGLASRSAFEKRIEELLQRCHVDDSTHALLFMDLDQFKIVNDTCGHIAGDELLRELAEVMSQHIRRSDMLARLGGDEFGVLLEGCDLNKAKDTAEELRTAVRNIRFTRGNRVFDVGVSIGLVSITSSSGDIATLMSNADLACYAAKDDGRNRIQVYSALNMEMHQRQSEMEWATLFSSAIKKGRLRLAIQQAQQLNENRQPEIYSEILLRILDESGKLISIDSFIRAAERYHFMPEIDRWVVKTTLSMLMAKQIPLRPNEIIAINLSGLSLADDDFLSFLQEQLFEYYEVPTSQICFEITETAAISNLSNAQHFIKTMRNLGCQFALDDFGSGLSSLSYLKNLPIDFLKIEGSFVKDMLHDPLDRVVVEAVGLIGQRMNIATIAEWVESDAILKAVQSLGIDYGQGFGISMPELIDMPDLVWVKGAEGFNFNH